MDQHVSQLIDALGGTTVVARLTKSKTSTVHSWRKNGISESRLHHLRLAAMAENPGFDFDTLAANIVPIGVPEGLAA
jgi:hypothetical protein